VVHERLKQGSKIRSRKPHYDTRDLFNDLLIVLLLLGKDVEKGSVHVSDVVCVSIPDSGHAFNEASLILREQTQAFCKRNLAHASRDGQPSDERLKALVWLIGCQCEIGFGGRAEIRSFSIGSITAYVFTVAMKSGSVWIDEIVPVGTSKCRSAALMLSFTRVMYLGHHTSKGSSTGTAGLGDSE
jgi:hypothetical protein